MRFASFGVKEYRRPFPGCLELGHFASLPGVYWSGKISSEPLLGARESISGHVDVDIRIVDYGSIRRRLF